MLADGVGGIGVAAVDVVHDPIRYGPRAQLVQCNTTTSRAVG
jgi:hypothetical protein